MMLGASGSTQTIGSPLSRWPRRRPAFPAPSGAPGSTQVRKDSAVARRCRLNETGHEQALAGRMKEARHGRTRSLDIVGMPLLDHYVTTLGLACSPASTSCTSTI